MLRTRLEPRVDRSDPVFDFIVDRIRADKPIVYSKINHGLWERLAAIEDAGYQIDEQEPHTTKAMDRLEIFRRPTPHMFEGSFVRELLDILQTIPTNNSNHIFAASLLAWPGRLEIAGLGEDETTSQAMMDRLIPKGALHREADGMEFKRAIINGTLVSFANALKTRKTLLVGNVNLSKYLEFLGVEDGRFLEIHPTDARGDRREILGEILKIIDTQPDIKVILLQAGGSLSAWLAHYIHNLNPDVSLIDIGLGSLICKPEAVLKTAFGRVYRNQIIACINAINPSWITNNCVELKVDESFTGRSNQTRELFSKSGVETPNSSFDPDIFFPKKIPFIAAKPVDETRVKQIMNGSVKPSDLAVSVLKQVMGLPQTDELIICPTKQEAFELAINVLEIEGRGQKPWISSPYLEAVHPRAIHRIDTAPSGLLTHDSISTHDMSNFSGVIFSNLFGGAIPAWNRMRNQSAKAGLSLIIDNRDGFVDRPKTKRPSSEIEIVSGAALQPWGAYDFGILIFSRQRAHLARSMIPKADTISQAKYAEWIDRLERYQEWSFFYTRQAQRLRQIMSRNLPALTEHLPEFQSKSPIGSLQYLCPKPFAASAMENEFFEVRRSLTPADPNFTNAKFLSDHLVSVPCHPFMRHVSKEDIIESLRALT